MKIIAICSAKGGSTKTTTTALLATCAMKNGFNVAMMDLNEDQGNLTGWWTMRGEPMNPRLVTNVSNIPAAVKTISKQFDLLVIDTPPLDVDVIEQAVVVADVVIIPVRPSALDAQTVAAIVFLAKKHNKPWAFLLSAVDSRDAGHRRLAGEAAGVLTKIAGEHGGRLLGNRIGYRLPYIKAMSSGKTGFETGGTDVVGEVTAVWDECKALMGGMS